MNNPPAMFQENNQPKPQFDSLNQCRTCGRRAGKFLDQVTYKVTGLFLYADVRGGMVCNICKEKYGDHIAKRKMTKKERKQLTKMKHEMKKLGNIPHVTLNSKGEVVE